MIGNGCSVEDGRGGCPVEAIERFERELCPLLHELSIKVDVGFAN